MQKHYDHKKIESKWQTAWEKADVFSAEDYSSKPKYYCLIEFPYPSGDGLHVGHAESYTAIDIVARRKRMQGFNVLYPIGWDAFGLPAENYAIKTKQHPRAVVEQNVELFTQQIKRMGVSFDWKREINTTDPEYYKWTQWIFLKLHENNLAYKAKIPINWCPSCKIGLANEEVIDGKCERCGAGTSRREIEQWMLKITEYADRLIEDLDTVDYLPRVREQQINWIGRSTGAEITFAVIPTDRSDSGASGGIPLSVKANNVVATKKGSFRSAELTQPAQDDTGRTGSSDGYQLTVFTTRPDTLYGATYMVIAPEHELIHQLEDRITNLGEVKDYVQAAGRKSDLERQENKEKTGVELKGIKATNPVNGEEIPIFVADYVLISYGTGAIMAVPAHDERDFEFAKQFDLKIVPVVEAEGGEKPADQAYVSNGQMINSDEFNGIASEEAKRAITEKAGGEMTTQYKLRDWVFSRQHYWGEPIPIVYCAKCWELQAELGNNGKPPSPPYQGGVPETFAPLIRGD